MTKKVRNIKLVTEDDGEYLKYLDNLKLERFHLRQSNQRAFSDLISYPLENTIREWVRLSGTFIAERILRFESLKRDNSYEKKFNEIDFIFFENDTYFLGEVKVSSSEKAIKKASSQLSYNYEILNQAGYNLELLIVHVNLNWKHSENEISSFVEDFGKMDFSILESGNFPINYIQLPPSDIFAWGVKKGFILDDTLLDKAIEEAENLVSMRALRQELIDQGVPQDEWEDAIKPQNKLQDQEYHVVSFGDENKPNLLAEKLKQAFKNKQ